MKKARKKSCFLPCLHVSLLLFVVDDIYPFMCYLYPRLLFSRVLFNKNAL